jgi:hypothetical protein
MSNVHMIGAPRKAGRRRERPIPGVCRAEVLSMAKGLEKRKGTTAQQITRLEITVQDMCRGLLQAIRAARASGVSLDSRSPLDFGPHVDTPEARIRHLEHNIAGMAHWTIMASRVLKLSRERLEGRR